MMDHRDRPLFLKLRREHRARLWLLPGGSALAVTAGALILQSLLLPLFFSQDPGGLRRAQAATALLSTAAAAGLAAVLYLRRRRRTAETAAELDAEAGAKNQLEAAWELKNSDHILRDELQKAADEAYRAFRFSRRPAGLKLVIAGLAVTLAGNLLIPAAGYAAARRAAAETSAPFSERAPQRTPQDGTEEPPHAESAAPAEYAELLLTHPEAEIRAKALDEIEWEGCGRSGAGFSTIVLTVFVNGEKRRELKPEELPKQPGEIRFGGFLPLEELDVKPFDLVSFHLTGVTEIGGKPTELLSTPQFIEIRPFREEAQLLDLPGGAGGGETFQLLNLFLGIQIDLNKALFRAEILRRQGAAGAGEFRNHLRDLKREQRELAADLEKYLNSEEARKIPADTVNHLEKSFEEMKKTSSALKELL